MERKHSWEKTNQQDKNKRAKNNTGNIFYARENFEGGENRLFYVLCVFYAQNLFIKKNRFEIVLITLINATTNVYSPQPPYRGLLCTYLFLFVIICENESLFFVRIFLNFLICENLYSLWESFWVFSFHEIFFTCENLFLLRESLWTSVICVDFFFFFFFLNLHRHIHFLSQFINILFLVQLTNILTLDLIA